MGKCVNIANTVGSLLNLILPVYTEHYFTVFGNVICAFNTSEDRLWMK